MVFNESGYMYILKRNGKRFDLTPEKAVPAGDFYHRATINFDGVFAQYFRPKIGNGSWAIAWLKPDNICVDIIDEYYGSGACGFNSICSLNGNQRPTCNCPQGYSLLDENDKFGSCKPDFELSCNGGGQGYNKNLYDLLELTRIDWPRADYEHLEPYDEVHCKNSCLSDCFSAAAIFKDNNCWLKNLPLLNGRKDSRLNTKAFIKYGKGDVNVPRKSRIILKIPKPRGNVT